MHRFAQTNLQLFNQLRQEGYSNTDLGLISKVYITVMQLFSGSFRSSGKTFIAHLVGTASILGYLHSPTRVVAAGLLHAAYEFGDFGDGIPRGISTRRRNWLREAIGQEAEEYVARYSAFIWNEKTIPEIYDRLDTFTPIERDILLIRLANELEEHLDLSLLYCGRERQHLYSTHANHLIIEMAIKLELPTLATELEQAIEDNKTAQIPIELFNQRNQSVSFLIAPKSYRKHMWITLYQLFTKGLHYLRTAMTHTQNQSTFDSTIDKKLG